MWNTSRFTNIGVLEFYECSDFRVFPNTRISSDKRIWSDDSSFSEVGISFNVGSRFENYSFFEVYISLYGHIWFDNCSFIDNICISTDNCIIGSEEIPRVSDRYPSTSRLNDTIHSFLYIDMNQISDLKLATRGEGNMAKDLEYLTVELVIPDISKIPNRWIRWFLYDSCSLLILITGKYPK